MTNEEILTANESWKKLLQANFPASTSYKLLKHFKQQVQPTLEPLVTANTNLFKQYGEQVNGSYLIRENTESFKKFTKERDDLYNEEAKIKPYPQSLESLLSECKSDLSATDLMALEGFFQ